MQKTIALSLALGIHAVLGSQQPSIAPLPHVRSAGEVGSGYLDNTTTQARTVFAVSLRYEQTTWLQLRFGEHTNLPEGSFLRMTALVDGGVQRHDGRTLAEWAMNSASFNGNEVRLELVAGPGTRGNRVTVAEVVRGLVTAGAPESICGPTDDRVQSNDARQGRLWAGCTGWLIGPVGAANDLMLTAGHCVGGTQILELNVPNSTAGGQVVRSAPNDQYPFTVTQSIASGVGADWGVCLTGRNSNTGLLPTQANGGTWYNLGTIPAVGANTRITGYGTSAIATLTQVQKTHVGPMSQVDPTALCYATDTTGGNSGSPVIDEASGRAVGIHTHGGCTSTGGCNSGTRIDRADLQAAIQAAGRTPGTFTTFGAGCQGTGTAPAGCASSNGSGGTSTLTTAPNEYAYIATAATPLSVNGFEIWSASNTGASVTVATAIYLDAGGAPAAAPLVTGTMTIGTAQGFYRTTFATQAIPAGTFYVAVDHTATTTYLANIGSGTPGGAFWRRPAGAGAWSTSGLVPNPSFNVLCAGGGGGNAVPAIGNLGLPSTGNSFQVTLALARANANAFLFTGFSNTTWIGGALPFSLAGLGGGTCSLLVATDVADGTTANASGAGSITITVPNNANLVGKRAYHQWFVIDPPANSLGIAVSNAATSTIGG